MKRVLGVKAMNKEKPIGEAIQSKKREKMVRKKRRMVLVTRKG